MITIKKWGSILALGALVALAGCDKSGEEADVAAHSEHDGHDHSGHDHDHDHGDEKAAPSPELKPLVVESGAPTQVIGVSQARETAPDGEEVTVEGRLKDFVAGKAAFTIVDGSIPSCKEMEDDHCPTPWDYCCVAPNKLAVNSAAVQLVGADGKVLDGNLQGVNSIDNLSTVVVTGKAEKDAAGNLVIAANKVFLK